MAGTPPTISTNNTSFNVGDTLSVTITFGTSRIGTLYIGNNSISIPQQKTPSYTYDYVLITSGNYSVYFRDDNVLDSNTINISVTASSSSSSVFLTAVTKVKTALENVFVKKTDITDNLTATDTDKPLSANQGKELKTLVDSKEFSSNKVNSWSDPTTDTNYPSEKLVKNSIDNLTNSINNLGNYFSTGMNGVYSTLNNYQNKNMGVSNKNVVTNESGYITTEDKPTIPSASSTTPSADTTSGSIGTGTTWAKADHTHPKSTLYATNNHNHDSIYGGTLGVTLLEDIDGEYVYAFDSELIYDVQNTGKIYYDPSFTYSYSSEKEIATIGDIPSVTGKEDTSNKSSSISADTGSTTKYPTIKAVEDYAQPKGNYLTSHQSLTNYIQKSETTGLMKNDGTIDTTQYLSQHQDISGKENISNKVSSWSNTTTDTNYPSEKLVKDNLDTKANISDITGTFTELQTLITNASNGDTIILDKDYKNTGSESAITLQNKPLTIIGNGHTIDGNNTSGIFLLLGQSTSVTYIFENINFINAKVNTASSYGSVLTSPTTNQLITVFNFEVYNCTFINNSNQKGGAIGFYNRSDINKLIRDCTFINNTATDGVNYGGAIYTNADYSNVEVINCDFVTSNDTVVNATPINYKNELSTINTALNGKANTSHTQTSSTITDMSTVQVVVTYTDETTETLTLYKQITQNQS